MMKNVVMLAVAMVACSSAFSQTADPMDRQQTTVQPQAPMLQMQPSTTDTSYGPSMDQSNSQSGSKIPDAPKWGMYGPNDIYKGN
jgi:hypothetical protein